MRPTRRTILASLAAGLALPSAALADTQRELLIEPVTPTSSDNTPYARFANQGPFGRPKDAVQISPTPGLRINVYVPPGQASGRVVVFSHAELVLPQVYDRLLGHWASHGFIVIAPLHDDSVLVDGLKARREDVSGVTWDIGTVINDPKAWRSRPRTLKAVLDALPVLEQTSGIRFTDDRPIVVGHSFGAFAAQLLLGARAWAADGSVLEEADPRFYAGILISGQGRGVLGLRDGSWNGVTRPFLAISGNGDYGATGQDPSARVEAFSLAPPGNKHLAWFSRVSPTLYTGQSVRAGTPEELVFGDLLAATTAMLVAYGDYDAAALGHLAGDEFTRASGGRMRMMYR